MTEQVVYDIVIGSHVGPFVFGSPISESIHALKNIQCKFEIIYDSKKPFDRDIILRSCYDHNNALTLRFDPVSQHLTAIDIDIKSLSKQNITLTYKNQPFVGKISSPTFVTTYKLLGPTTPGTFDPDVFNAYVLPYQNNLLRAIFPIPKEFQDTYTNTSLIPMELPDGCSTTPELERLVLLAPTNSNTTSTTTTAVISISDNSTVSFTHKSLGTIAIGDSVQQVVSEIGPALSSMKSSSCYYNNYQHLGIDCQFSEKNHKLIKVVFHTNAVGHFDFNSYVKSQFSLKTTNDVDITPETCWNDDKSKTKSSPVIHDAGASPFGSTKCYNLLNNRVSIEVMQNGYISTLAIV